VEDVIFSEFEMESEIRRGQLVWFKGVIRSIPNMDKRNAKHYAVEFEDRDVQVTVEASELFLHLPKSGVAFDGGRYSRIVKARLSEKIPMMCPTSAWSRLWCRCSLLLPTSHWRRTFPQLEKSFPPVRLSSSTSPLVAEVILRAPSCPW
jgi:hypothetical protein